MFELVHRAVRIDHIHHCGGRTTTDQTSRWKIEWIFFGGKKIARRDADVRTTENETNRSRRKAEKERNDVTCKILPEGHSRDTIGRYSDRYPNCCPRDNAIGEHNECRRYGRVNEL